MTSVVVYHGMYGCDTGCCGHWVELTDANDPGSVRRAFVFGHGDSDDPLSYAKQLVQDEFGEEHVADLDWENCKIVADCDW